MNTVVCPDTPIVVGVALGVFAVLVVQESDDFVQHASSHRNAGTENRARKLQREVGADALVCDKIFEATTSVRGRVVVKLDALVDALLDCVMHSGLEMGLGQTLTKFKIALIEELVPWDRHPVDVPEPAIDAHTRTVLGIVQPGRWDSAPPQLREWCL